MSPLAIIKFVIERIEAAGYGPFADVVLLMVFLASAYFLIARFLMHKQSKELALKARSTAQATSEWYKSETSLAPGAEAFRSKVAPYIEFVGSVYFVVLSLGLCIIVVLVSLFFLRQIGWLYAVGGCVVGLAFFVMFQIQLARSTWAWHSIQQQRNLTTGSRRRRR